MKTAREKWIDEWRNYPHEFDFVMSADKPGLLVCIEKHSKEPIDAFDNKPFIIVSNQFGNLAAFNRRNQAVKFINQMGWSLTEGD